MKVKVLDEKGWYFEGFNPCGSVVECSESVYIEASKSVKLVEDKPKKVEDKPKKKKDEV